MSSILDLRPKPKPIVKIVERVIDRRAPWWLESLKMLIVVMTVSLIVYGISKASIEQQASRQLKNWSVSGVVSGISGDKISLINAKTPQGDSSNLEFSVSSSTKIETRSYVPIILDDISIGDRVIAQGVVSDEETIIRRLILLSTTTVKTSATSTEVIPVQATSTGSTETGIQSTQATSIEATSTDATSTEATSTEMSATSTEATSTDSASIDATSTNQATTSAPQATTTDSTEPVSSPPVPVDVQAAEQPSL